ncbi:putative alpha/beta hydrolase [Aspergillus heteromorphus CBS 117.55]|uniref:Putative alpha/beta hydrolase n=1 Tax=Aspergillus heteromorphus CBS 117.55 TaxID=1448321 RepID=A0A317VZK2_9EURO|nr:putative alpha/beta hydrolase [Aspergillus heteromorphus CBS 117.55]PWY78368.1 putative alpha/beta hydrolase [Aspergillus heteromorphus CBS 117.55]
MSEITITEGEFRLPDGVAVYQKTWSPPIPKAKLVHFHGFSDHINNSNELFTNLAQQGIHVSGIDQRGWGRSAPTKASRGNTGPTPFILADLASFIKSQQSEIYPDLPLFISGHSMGGGLVATLASTPEYQPLVSSFRGIILLAPLIGLTPMQTPSSVTVFLGRLAGKLLPHHQLTQRMKIESIARDPDVQTMLRSDPLNHGTGTLEMFAAMLDRTADLSSGKLVLQDGVRSVYLAHGNADGCTSFEASRKWFDSQTGGMLQGDKCFKEYDGWCHVLHLDSKDNRKTYADDLAGWILGRE